MRRTETARIVSALTSWRWLVAAVLLLALSGVNADSAAAAQSGTVAVYLGREIAPYVAMVEGLEAALSPQPVERVFLDAAGRPYSLSGNADLNPQNYRALVAVGPRALDFLLPRAKTVPLLFGMVMNPAALDAARDDLCGVSLNLPIAGQLTAIRKQLPAVQRLGVLYDPANNQSWFARATDLAATLPEFQLVPLPVTSRAERLNIVADFSAVDALLFIPDKTIISQAVIRYVIEQAFLRRLPVVGYNQFFLDSGAALGFVIDYRQVGRQVAGRLSGLLSGQTCGGIRPPQFDVKRNPDVFRALLRLDQPGGSP